MFESPRFGLVAHTHWDREWYLTFEAGLPHFHLDGQTAPIDDYLALRPEREAEVWRVIADGRLAVGPWFTLVDEFLVSGETIIRSLERGSDQARELGRLCRIGYLPDEFGHVGQMPQLLAQAGIEHAVVWRGVPAAIDRSTFTWEAPDGSTVTTEYLPFGYSIGHDLTGAPVLDDARAILEGAAGALGPFAVRDTLLLLLGEDHASPNQLFLRRLTDLDGTRSDVRIMSIEEVVETPLQGEPPRWRGELRSASRAALLPNVYSTRVGQKRERAELEGLIERYAEPLAALVSGVDWPGETLDRAWRLLLWNAAHDSVCGCSLDEVADAVDARHLDARRLVETVVDAALSGLGVQVAVGGVLRFNPSPFERSGVPGLGWRVDPMGTRAAPSPVTLEAADGRVKIDGWIELTLESEDDVGDLYTFCPGSDGGVRFPGLMVEGESVRATLDGCVVDLRIRRLDGEDFYRLELVVDNERRNHRLRLRVRLPQKARASLAGSPFELVERPLIGEGGQLEPGSPNFPAQGFVLAGGLAILADGVFEYETTPAEFAVTLFRGVGTISQPYLETRRLAAGPDINTPAAQLLGRTRLAFGVWPDASSDRLVEMQERFALPLRSAPTAGGGPLPSRGQLLEVHGAALSSVRRRPGGLEARIWNPASVPTAAFVDAVFLQLRAAEIRTVRPAADRR
jgi:hypothetical protein